MAAQPNKPLRSPLALWPEALKVALWQAFGGWRRWLRATWAYRRFLKGTLSDRVGYQPYDLLPRKLDDADAYLRGRFRFEGETVEAGERSIFDERPPSQGWSAALHGFAWMPPLSAAGGEASRTLATNLVSQWLKRYGKYAEPAWLPHVMARRLVVFFSHSRFIVTNSDMMWRSKVFVSLREQSRMLARIAKEAPEGLPRIETATALVLSGACLEDSPKRLERGVEMLEAELTAQILPDGGHISRSPQDLVMAYRQTVLAMEVLNATGHGVPAILRSLHDRMAPMIRFFRHGDGALALFNGGGESDARMIQALLQRDDTKGHPFAHAPHSGYHRIQAGKTLALLDCGMVPPGAYSATAHAGCLAFELSAGHHRLIVNCGSAILAGHRRLRDALRATAAHSTVTLADTSSAAVLAEGWIRRRLGARLLHGPKSVETRRSDTQKGTVVVASHDGYLETLGLRHERELILSPHGLALTGADRLIPLRERKAAVNYAVRFHIHPDVRTSRSQSGDVMLKLPGGEGWRFRATGPVAIEESLYLGGDAMRRSEQLVVTGTVKKDTAEIGWIFEQIGASAG